MNRAPITDPGGSRVLRVVVISAVVAASGALWAAGLLLFVRADMTPRWKVTWVSFLLLVGVGIGAVLPLREVWTKFLWVMVLVPLGAAADVLLLHSRRGLTYWVRACGFEVVTVFATATAARYALDWLQVRAVAERLVP